MKKYIFIVFSFTLLTVSCTERIDFDLSKGQNNKLVVNAYFTDELKIQTVKLSRSTDYYRETPPAAELEASVTISDGTQTFNFYDADNDGLYATEVPIAGIPGKTYSLNIILKTGTQYTAESYLKPVGIIDSLRYEYISTFIPRGGMEQAYLIYLYAAEPPTVGDYYLWDYFIDNHLESDTLREKVFTDDKFVNGNYISKLTLFYVENNKIVNDSSEIEVKMYSISKEHYQYYLAIMYETQMQGNPFSGPPANVPSNISGDGLGFFSAMAVSSKKITIVRGENPVYWDLK